MPTMFRYRLIFGTIMVAGLMALIFADDRIGRINIGGTFLQPLLLDQSYLPAGVLVVGVFLVIAALGARELADLFIAKGVPADRTVMIISAMLGLATMYLTPRDAPGRLVLPLAMTPLVVAFLLGMLRHVARKQTAGALAAGGATLFAAIYLGVIPGFFLLIRAGHSAWVLAAVIMLTKACDIGAYTAGRKFGRHKLIPWLSPGKTWEGLAGGVAFSVIVALLLAFLHNHFQWLAHAADPTSKFTTGEFTHRPFSLAFAALLGALLAVLGHAGDLLESLLKRDAGVKDSGSAIPGFGGVLDVVDSPIFIAPVAYWLLA